VLGKKVGIDLGTTAVRLHLKGEGVTLDEPAVVATALGDDRVLAHGTAALAAVARGGTRLRAPLHQGAVADSLALDALLNHVITRAVGRQRIFRPDVMVAVVPVMSGDDRRTLMEVAARAGARTVYLIESPLAAAIGAGLSVSSRVGHLVADLGGGTTDIAVVALDGIVSRRTVCGGGQALTRAIADHLGAGHGVPVDLAAAEDAKREIGSATPLVEERTLRLALGGEGRRGEVVVSSTEVKEAMGEPLGELATAVLEVLEDCPEPLLSDIRTRTGLVLTGGGARLRGLDRYLAAATGLRVELAADPQGCVARGAGTALESLDLVRRNFLYLR
jgi:rod shape-determining protein MreB and related proteins